MGPAGGDGGGGSDGGGGDGDDGSGDAGNGDGGSGDPEANECDGGTGSTSGGSGRGSGGGRGNGGSDSGDGQGTTGGEGTETSKGSNGQGDGEDGSPSTAEKVVMVVSALFTLVFFSFALWQVVAAPATGDPTVRVADTRTTAGGEVVVTVELRNTQDVGLSTAIVEAQCTSPPTELTFQHVPSGGRRTGQIVCPPGTEDPKVSLASWIER